ncbi:MAG: M48 family metallopeptidase [Planctomycetota bacterium]
MSGTGPVSRGAVARRAAGGLALALVPLAGACQATPVTGRTSFNVFTPADDVQLGAEAYGEILAGARIVPAGAEKEMVERVMGRLVAVADDPGYAWEVRLIDDGATANAFALPGGKMAVYSGILPICGGEEGLAVVMGHEIGHVVAQHGTERMTRELGVELALGLLEVGDYAELARVGMEYFVTRPFSRANEAEADHIGLIYMARAGYDPRAAPSFWERMVAAGGAEPPEFLSTHPSHETRIQNLQDLLPEAIAEYEGRGGPR